MSIDRTQRRVSWSLILLGFLGGCDQSPRSTSGGTPGIVHVGAKYPLSDIQVNVYKVGPSGPELVGNGVSRLDGRFELVKTGAETGLWLEPADYAFTIESVGSVPLQWKEPLGKISKTPLRRVWSTTDVELDMDLPEPTGKRP